MENDLVPALPNLNPVINWLKSGCDPIAAANELEIYQRQIERFMKSLEESSMKSIDLTHYDALSLAIQQAADQTRVLKESFIKSRIK